MVKNLDPAFNPWIRKISWRRGRLPTPVFLPGEFHGQRSPWVTKSWTQLNDFHFLSQITYLFTLLLHLFIYLSFFPLSDPLELFSPYQDTLWSAIFGDWLESLFLSGNTGPHLCYTRTSL